MTRTDVKDYNDLVDVQQDQISRLKELNDKFKWQVRDTCARAEKAEAEIKLMEPVVNAAIRLVSPEVNRRYDPSYELKLLGLAVREYEKAGE